MQPTFEDLPREEDIRNYNRAKNMTPDRNKQQKYFADLKRVCEVEDTVVEWFDKEHYESIAQESLKSHLRRQIDDFLNILASQFDFVRIEVGGIDFSVWKILVKAQQRPLAADDPVFYPDLNLAMRVVKEVPLINEVKKVGVIIDRGQRLELRPGDLMLIYVSMGGFEK